MAAKCTRKSSEKKETVPEDNNGFSDKVAQKVPASLPELFGNPQENIKRIPRETVQIGHS